LKSTWIVTIALLVMVFGRIAAAQTDKPPSEDVEPRTIADRGTTMVGGALYLDQVYSSERLLPLNFTILGDVTRFVTPRIALRGGVAGGSSRGGDDIDDAPSGLGAPALHGHGAALFYFSPASIWSLYAGAGFSSQLTRREDTDPSGTVQGIVGLQGAISSRVHVFVEGSYGTGLSRSDEQTTRITTYAGLRLRLWR
jgi:hypothetical protein